jgi:hypothetical protein
MEDAESVPQSGDGLAAVVAMGQGSLSWRYQDRTKLKDRNRHIRRKMKMRRTRREIPIEMRPPGAGKSGAISRTGEGARLVRRFALTQSGKVFSERIDGFLGANFAPMAQLELD